MLRDMFIDIREPSITVGSKKRYTVAMSVLVHTAITAAVLIIPLVATDVLPTPQRMTVFVTAPVTPPPPPPPLQAARRPVPEAVSVSAPLHAPSGLAPEHVAKETSMAPLDDLGSVCRCVVADGLVEGRNNAVPPPPPTPAPASHTPRHPGGDIKPPTKIKDVRPLYPTIAQTARVQGVVIVEATIGPDGVVQTAKVLRSIPLLDQAALDAVRQWLYTPTLLNGVPVPVIMTVTVNFTLQ